MGSSEEDRIIDVQLFQLTGTPVSPSPHSITMSLFCSGRRKNFSRFTLPHIKDSIFQQDCNLNASFSSDSHDCTLVFIFSSTDPPQELAKVSIPLDQLPLNQQVQESFQMEPLVATNGLPRIFVKLCLRSEAISDPFDPEVPLGVLIARQKAVSFTSDHRTQEFGSVNPSSALSLSGSIESFSTPPIIITSQVPVIDEEEEEAVELAMEEIAPAFGTRECEWRVVRMQKEIEEVDVQEAPEDPPAKPQFVLNEELLPEIDGTKWSWVEQWEIVESHQKDES
jgi:hypothetical protein